MILYHGSDVDIQEIELNQGLPKKDFGKGFYLTDVKKHAEDVATRKSRISNRKPVVNKFQFEEDVMTDKTLKVKIFSEYSLEWAEFVKKNRTGEPVEQYDIVYGPVADDTVGLQIRLLIDGLSTMETFLERLKYYKGITFQYFFGTEAALTHLKKINS